MVFETIDSYLQHGSVVYGCLLDCTKAFDTIRHSTLFTKLINAKLPPVIVRILLYLYQNQTARVRWKGHYSEDFTIRNGVRQGAVISPLFFSFYMDGLFEILSSSGSGCSLNRYYSGCFGYADDLFLISPSRSGLQDMLNLASEYVEDHNISFSTHIDPAKSKTKGIVFSRKRLNYEPEPLLLNSNELPWVHRAKYLGNIIEDVPNGLLHDAKVKRAKYIERNVELELEFQLAHPEVKCKINSIYNSSFPGSTLYDITSESVRQLVNSWSVSVRQMWNLPLNAHRYLVEPLGGEHAFSMITIRFVKFLQSIRKSEKIPVQFMLRKVLDNVNTVTGKNARFIQERIGTYDSLLNINTKQLKSKLKFCPIENADVWKVNLIREITNINHSILQIEPTDESDIFLTKDQLKEIVNYVSSY